MAEPHPLSPADQLRYMRLCSRPGNLSTPVAQLVADATARLAQASIAGEPTADLAADLAQLERIRAFDSPLWNKHRATPTPSPPTPPDPNAQPLPRSPALRLVELALSPAREKIFTLTAQERDDVDYVPRFLCCTALPSSRVVPSIEVWAAWAKLYRAPLPDLVKPPGSDEASLRITRRNIDRWIVWGRERGIPVPVENTYVRETSIARLEMVSSRTFGCPYGIPPRRIIKAIATTATLQRNSGRDPARIVLGHTYSQGIRRLLDAQYLGGREFAKNKQQFLALINSHILWWQDKTREEEFERYEFVSHIQKGLPLNSEFKKHRLWEVSQDGMVLILGELFLQDILKRKIPIDDAIFDELARHGNCLAVDIYVWLTMRAFPLKLARRIEMRPISWQKLKIQFGGEYTDLRLFRVKFLAAARRVATLYRKMSFEEKTPLGRSRLDGNLVFTLKDTSVSAPFQGYGPGTVTRQGTGTYGAAPPPTPGQDTGQTEFSF
jgi:hypothetical protein